MKFLNFGSSGSGAPDPVIVPASKSIFDPVKVESPDQKTQEMEMVKVFMAQNRAFRRGFKRKNGIMIPGSTRPVVNNKRQK